MHNMITLKEKAVKTHSQADRLSLHSIFQTIYNLNVFMLKCILHTRGHSRTKARTAKSPLHKRSLKHFAASSVEPLLAMIDYVIIQI